MNKLKYFQTEINYLKSDSHRRDLEYLINLLPEYFFTIPASSTGKYHPQFASTKHGLVKHTKVAVRIAYDLFETVNFTEHDEDLVIMALVLHDGLKKGITESEYTKFDHPLLVSKLILEHAANLEMDIDDVRKLCSLIESHMGKWNTNKYSKVELPVPRNELEKYVHRCDYLASRNYLNVKFNKLEVVASCCEK